MPTIPSKSRHARTHIRQSGSSQPGSRVAGCSEPDPISRVQQFLEKYIAIKPRLSLAVATWIVAAWSFDAWDRFPILLITSPQKRCGKTRMVSCLEQVLPHALNTTAATAAAIYRQIDLGKVSLLIDEAQSLSRRSREDSASAVEQLCGSIDRDATVLRCVGEEHKPKSFSTACPKVVAHIGEPDPVLADRSLIIPMERRSRSERVERYVSRKVKQEGAEISSALSMWSVSNRSDLGDAYEQMQQSEEIENDRLAELLMPLQAVARISCPDCAAELLAYARDLDKASSEEADDDLGVIALSHLREVFEEAAFLPTKDIVERLVAHDPDLWGSINSGRPLNPKKLAALLRGYGVRPDREQPKVEFGAVTKTVTVRGYRRESLLVAWERYLQPAEGS